MNSFPYKIICLSEISIEIPIYDKNDTLISYDTDIIENEIVYYSKRFEEAYDFCLNINSCRINDINSIDKVKETNVFIEYTLFENKRYYFIIPSDTSLINFKGEITYNKHDYNENEYFFILKILKNLTNECIVDIDKGCNNFEDIEYIININEIDTDGDICELIDDDIRFILPIEEIKQSIIDKTYLYKELIFTEDYTVFGFLEIKYSSVLW